MENDEEVIESNSQLSEVEPDGYLAKMNRRLELRALRFKNENWMRVFGKYYSSQGDYIGPKNREAGILNILPRGPGEDPFVNNRSTGRKGRSFKTVFNELLEAVPTEGELDAVPVYLRDRLSEQLGREVTRRDLLGIRLMQRAILDADVSAFNAIADRVEGKPIQVTKNENRNMNYTDFLDAKVRESEPDEAALLDSTEDEESN